VDSLKTERSKLESAGWNPATPNLILINLLMKAKLINESLKVNFSFKKDVPVGRYRSFDAQNNYDIKLNRKVVGSIGEVRTIGPSVKEDEGKFVLRFIVNKKDPMEDKNPNCVWKWITLKRRFESAEEAKQFVLDNAEIIMKQFDLHCLED
jgi:hypothetical protein